MHRAPPCQVTLASSKVMPLFGQRWWQGLRRLRNGVGKTSGECPKLEHRLRETWGSYQATFVLRWDRDMLKWFVLGGGWFGPLVLIVQWEIDHQEKGFHGIYGDVNGASTLRKSNMARKSPNCMEGLEKSSNQLWTFDLGDCPLQSFPTGLQPHVPRYWHVGRSTRLRSSNSHWGRMNWMNNKGGTNS